MSWTFDNPMVVPPVVKQDGLCKRQGMHKFCPYWVAMKETSDISRDKRILGYRCQIFQKDKNGYQSLPECNERYGLNYDGPPINPQ